MSNCQAFLKDIAASPSKEQLYNLFLSFKAMSFKVQLMSVIIDNTRPLTTIDYSTILNVGVNSNRLPCYVPQIAPARANDSC